MSEPASETLLARNLLKLAERRLSKNDFPEALAAATEAGNLYQQDAIRINRQHKPMFALALAIGAVAQLELGESREALASVGRAVAVLRDETEQPSGDAPTDENLPVALSLLGSAQIRLGLPEDALITADMGIAVAERRDYQLLPLPRCPGPAGFWLIRATALLALDRLNEAVAAIAQSLTIATTRDAARLHDIGLPVLSGVADRLATQNIAATASAQIAELTDKILRRPVTEEATADQETDADVSLYRQMAQYTPESARPALASLLRDRAVRLREQGDLGAALTAAAESVEVNRSLATANPDVYTPHLARAIGEHAAIATEIADQQDDAERLITAAMNLRSAVDMLPSASSDRADLLAQLVDARLDLASRTGDLRHVSRAISEARSAVESVYELGHRIGVLAALAEALRFRFDHAGDLGDVDESIGLTRLALDACEPEDPGRIALLTMLADSLQARQAATGSLQDLDEATHALRQATELTERGDPTAGSVFYQLGSVLMSRYVRTGNLADLDNAIRSQRQAAAAIPDSDGQTKSGLLSNLSQALYARYTAAASSPRRAERPAVSDLDEAVATARRSVALTPADIPTATTPRYLLGVALFERYQATGQAADLHAAIDMMRGVADAAPASANQNVALLNLAAMLRAELDISGNASSLDDAIAVAGEVLRRVDPDDVLREHALGTRSDLLETRYRRSGNEADLGQAITGWRELAGHAAQQPERSRALVRLSHALRIRYTRTRDADDIFAAIEAASAAMAAASDDQLRARSLHAQAEAIFARFAVTSDQSDLDQVTDLMREAVAMAPDDDLDRSAYRATLASALAARLTGTTDPADRAVWLTNRFVNAGDRAALTEAMGILRLIAESIDEPALDRIRAAHQFGRLAMSDSQFDDALYCFQIAIEQLPRLLSDRIWRENQLLDQGSLTELVSDAAACALEAGRPEQAVRWLEQGRIVLLSQALDAEDELAPLRKLAPRLADRLLEIRGRLGDATGRQTDASSRHLLEREFEGRITQIRAIPGLERFAMQPDVTGLLAWDLPGAVVLINVSDYRCDALALTPTAHSVRVISLPDLSRQTVLARARAFQEALTPSYRPLSDRLEREGAVAEVLSWLWDAVAAPILSALDLDRPPGPGRQKPRLWWIPTGPMALFPLHAAGHTVRASQATNVLDYVVSSYAVSITALAHAGSAPAPAVGAQSRLVVLPEYLMMPGAAREADAVTVCLSARLLRGRDATRERVLTELRNAQILHFAGHSTYNSTNPAASVLLLSDSQLSLDDIMATTEAPRSLAFLSACASAQTLPADAGEVVNFGMVLQQAGYRHTVCTLWEVTDRAYADIAQSFYSQITADGLNVDDSALTLHAVVSRFRERFPHIPSLWASHIHVGP